MRKLVFIFVSALMLFAACSGPVKKPRHEYRPRPTRKSDMKKLLDGAKQHIGEPYRYGGVSSKGWDCSGFVSGMFRRYLDISLPRDTRGLYSVCKSVNPRDTRPGDLVFFRIGTAKPSHVGIYLGKNRFIHASTSSGVIVSGLYEDYYRKHFMGYRRIPGSYLANNR
jgi:cell wall-associated NlpC family hydrolase